MLCLQQLEMYQKFTHTEWLAELQREATKLSAALNVAALLITRCPLTREGRIESY